MMWERCLEVKSCLYESIYPMNWRASLRSERRTAQEVVIDLLNRALGIDQVDGFETPEQVVASTDRRK